MSALLNERCGRYYDLYVEAAERAHDVHVSWANVCASGGLVEADDAPDAYEHFDSRDQGWTKVVLKPGQSNGPGVPVPATRARLGRRRT